MANTYSNDVSKKDLNLKPKKETIDFLLQYSKSLSVIKSENYTFEIINN